MRPRSASAHRRRGAQTPRRAPLDSVAIDDIATLLMLEDTRSFDVPELTTALAATRVFAIGQLRDTLTIPWLDSLLANSRTARTVATEAACALGKIKTAAAREVLARFLTRATAGPRTNDAIGEALLSIGRSTARGDIAPILKWTSSTNEAIRWRATWALFRPRDPAAVPALLKLEARARCVRARALMGGPRTHQTAGRLGIGRRPRGRRADGGIQGF